MSPEVMAESKKDIDKRLREEKERLLDEKMRIIRQKNEERLKRQKEIEEDIRNANSHSDEAVAKRTTDTKVTMSGVNSNNNKSVSKFRGGGRGRILEKMSQEQPKAQQFKERQKANYRLVESELKEEKTSQRQGFLSDDHRADMSKMVSRSTHSWGGSQFKDVVEKVKSRDSRHKREQIDPVINMTGKERLKYQEWKQERARVDQARQSRQKRGESWQREWDKAKVKDNKGSIGRRQGDGHDRTQNSQRLKSRHKPDWDLHVNRGTEHGNCVDTPSFTNQTSTNDIPHKSLSEDWDLGDDGVIKDTLNRQPATFTRSNNSMSLHTHKATSKDLENHQGKRSHKSEYLEPTSRQDLEEETRKKTDFADKDNSCQVNYPTAKDRENSTVASMQVVDDCKREKNNSAVKNDVYKLQNTGKTMENFTIKVDGQGHRDISESSCATEENLLSESVQKNVVNASDMECVNDDTIGERIPSTATNSRKDLLVDAIQEKQEGALSRELDADTEQNGNDTAKTALKAGENLITEENQATHVIKSSSKGTNITDIIDSTPKESKPKDVLPKLDLTKTDKEPSPDFLKTPQYKDWADYDFDEEQLEFSGDLSYYE